MSGHSSLDAHVSRHLPFSSAAVRVALKTLDAQLKLASPRVHGNGSRRSVDLLHDGFASVG